MKWVNQYNIQSIYKLPEILRNGVKKMKRIIILLLAILMIISLTNVKVVKADDVSTDNFSVHVTAKEMYENAFEVLNLVNKERKKEKLPALVMDQSLLETAMLRGFETIIYWNHTRPDGTLCFTANSKMMGENIAAWQTSPKEVMSSWMNSQGHKDNILNSDYKSIGVGCVYINGSYYWVQCFGMDDAQEVEASSYKDKKNSRDILVKKDKEYYKADMEISSNNLKIGQTATVSVWWNGNKLPDSGAVTASSDPSVCEIKDGKLIAKKAGKANIKMYFNGYEEGTITQKVTVKENKIKVPTVSIKKLKNKKGKKLYVQLNKTQKVKGYQIVYSTNKNFKKASTRTIKNTSLTISKLKKKKTYYVKARAYKKDSSGKKVFGTYSKVKKVKINY